MRNEKDLLYTIPKWNWVFLKLSSSAEFMINFSVQSIIPFLVQHTCFPQDWGVSKKRENWNHIQPPLSLSFEVYEAPLSLKKLVQVQTKASCWAGRWVTI